MSSASYWLMDRRRRLLFFFYKMSHFYLILTPLTWSLLSHSVLIFMLRNFMSINFRSASTHPYPHTCVMYNIHLTMGSLMQGGPFRSIHGIFRGVYSTKTLVMSKVCGLNTSFFFYSIIHICMYTMSKLNFSHS